MSQSLIFTNNPAAEIDAFMAEQAVKGRVFVLVDSNTARYVLPLLSQKSRVVAEAEIIEIPAGDENKTLETLASVWRALSNGGASRQSMLINVGGGMVTDLGGFAAATFKRGIPFINVATTLLGAVDAAVGGKTGINFCGLKNEIGAFDEAKAVIVSTSFFDTLPLEQLTSGYAEMIKHALISSPEATAEVLNYDIAERDGVRLLDLLSQSVKVKQRIVAEDPYEKGIRRALNLGHTVAHAFEALAMERHCPVAHGHAVAWGLVVDLVLSTMLRGFPSAVLHTVAAYVDEHYPKPLITCGDYPQLTALMRHDKKNVNPDAINFTLLDAPGQVRIDQMVDEKDICAALDIFRDLLHI